MSAVAARGGAAAPAANPWLIAPVVALAAFMEIMDISIANVSLPHIAGDLSSSQDESTWVLTSYLVTNAIVMPISGWLSNTFGRKNFFLVCIAGFTASSLLCGLAPNLASLILLRAIQGATGGGLQPAGQAILADSFPPDKRGMATAIYGISAVFAPTIGPTLGGWITDSYDWRWIFLINVPIGALGYALVTRYIRDSAGTLPQGFDLAGWMLVGGGLAGLVLGFENLGKRVLPAEIPPFLVVMGAALLALYVRHARSDASPILRLSLLRIATFRASVTGGTLFRIGVGSFSLLMPMMLQLGFGLSPLNSGLVTFSSAVGALLMKTMAQKLTRRYGFRRLLVWNTLISSAALAGCGGFSAATPHLFIIAFLLVSGFFRSLEFTCVNTLAFADVEERDMSQATSFSSTAQQLALSMGIGIGSQVLNLSLAARHAAELLPRDFTAAFCAVGLVSLSALLSFLRLAPDAGSNVSGHRIAVADMPTRITHQ